MQMATARRSEGLGLADADRLFRSPASSNRSLALASKASRGGGGDDGEMRGEQ